MRLFFLLSIMIEHNSYTTVFSPYVQIVKKEDLVSDHSVFMRAIIDLTSLKILIFISKSQFQQRFDG